MPGWQAQVGGGVVFYFGEQTEDNGLALRAVPMPGTDQAGRELLVTASFVPLQNATTFDTDMMERYADALCDGAKGALMRIPKQLWTDKDSAVDYDNQFKKSIDDARIEVLHGFMTGSVRARPRSFGS